MFFLLNNLSMTLFLCIYLLITAIKNIKLQKNIKKLKIYIN